MITAVQNTDIPMWIDFGDIAPLDSITWKLFKHDEQKTTVAEFRYPTASGFGEVAIDGTVYSIIIPKAKTTTLLGSYGIEVIYSRGGVQDGGQTAVGSIILKAK
jgi:hypothetical protein